MQAEDVCGSLWGNIWFHPLHGNTAMTNFLSIGYFSYYLDATMAVVKIVMTSYRYGLSRHLTIKDITAANSRIITRVAASRVTDNSTLYLDKDSYTKVPQVKLI